MRPSSARSSYHRGRTPPHHTPEGGRNKWIARSPAVRVAPEREILSTRASTPLVSAFCQPFPIASALTRCGQYRWLAFRTHPETRKGHRDRTIERPRFLEDLQGLGRTPMLELDREHRWPLSVAPAFGIGERKPVL